MDCAAVPEHKTEHVFMCVSDGLLSLLMPQNNYFYLCMYSHYNIESAYVLICFAYLGTFALLQV